jgi:RNA-directed DNA polymerase
LEESKGWQPTESGTPQGGVISPLLANLYLDPLDHQMEGAGWELVRYADDFVILCRNQAQAQDALSQVQTWVKEAGLTLHPEKTRIVNANAPGGFDFLGYHFERGMKWPRHKSLKKLKERIQMKTSRLDGRSLKEIITDVNRTMKGWYGYFQHSKANTLSMWMATFEDDYAACCNGGGMDGAKARERPINAGPTNGLPTMGCCPWQQNMSGRVQS